MIHRFLIAFVGFILLVSCESETNTIVPPVDEFLVVGNDRGFRDDYINQANLVTVHDSSITVRSLRSVDNPRTYPIVAGYVHGGNDPVLHWAMDTIGRDTISLRDTSRNSTFYLQRLNRVDSLPGALPFLTSGELEVDEGEMFRMYQTNYVFNDGGQGAGCLITRGYLGVRDWARLTKFGEGDTIPPVSYYVRREIPQTAWRLYERFAQPILVQDNKNGMFVTLLDSLASDQGTLFGRTISDRNFEDVRTFILRNEKPDLVTPPALQALPADPVKSWFATGGVAEGHHARWSKNEMPEDYLVVTKEDAEDLRLRFSGKTVQLDLAGESLFTADYRPHDKSPYLIVGDECESDDHWLYRVHGDSITISIPLRVDIPTTGKPRTFTANGRTVTLPPSRYYLPDEWKATYLLDQGK